MLIALACALLAAWSASAQQSKKPRPIPPKLCSHVILVTVNGLRADYQGEKYRREYPLPALRALQTAGAATRGIEGVYPTLGAPSHASILTGALPADHGVTAEFVFDEKTGAPTTQSWISGHPIKGETLPRALERAGLRAVSIGFLLPGTGVAQTDESQGVAAGKKQKPDELAAALAEDERRVTAALAALAAPAGRPNLLLLNLAALDAAHRRYGVFSAQAAATLAKIDAALARLREGSAGMAGDMVMMVAAPYGAAAVESEFRPGAALARIKKKALEARNKKKKDKDKPEELYLEWEAVVEPLGGAAAVYLQNPGDEAAVQAVEGIFQQLHAESNSPVWRILDRRDIARLGADPRAILFLDAAPRFTMSGRRDGDVKSGAGIMAGQGYLPQRMEMHGVFALAGKGIRPGATLEYSRLIDLAPTIARLLGVEMPSARGRVLSEALTDYEKNPNPKQ
ncbi:MAG: alkaline phosphatase family protein [Blastocatellia bacterium]